MIIGLNYEDPLDTTQRSQINIGKVNYDEVVFGSLGVNFYSNLAVDAWGLLMDDIKYNGVDVSWDH